MSDRRTVIMATVVLNTRDFATIEKMARGFRALYSDAHHEMPYLVQGGYVIATEMSKDAARDLELRLTKMAADGVAQGAPVETSDPEMAALFAKVANSRKQ